MNSEANDSTDATVSNEETDTVESIAETSGETRTDRIRRLNRERQRRRREKLRMSRQSEAPSTTSNDVEPSHDLELLSEGCAIVEVMLPLKVETEIPEELDKETPKVTRPKRSTRTRQKSRKEASTEQISSDTVSSANNAISPPCHDNNSNVDGASDENSVLVVASEVEVVDEKPQENGTEEATETPETKADGKRRRTRESKRQTDKSPEDVATKRVFREREKRKMHGSNDEVTARREKQRELKRKQKERMSSDQIEALRARYREWRRKRKETMTNEQLEIIRKGNRERQRRRRERLGIRKRSTTPQAKGVSEAVIQGIKNKQAHIIKPLESSLSPEASLVAAVNQVASLNSVEAAAAAAALMPNPSRIEGPVAVTVEVNPAAPGMQSVIQNTHGLVQPSSTPQLVSLPVTSTNVTQGTFPPGMSVLGPQGQILQGLPPGSGALYSMTMSGIQGALLSGIPVTAGQTLSGVQGINTVPGMPFSGMQGLMPGMSPQGAFLSASQAGVLPGMQTFSSMAPTMTKDGQILHSISTLLPIAPMQGMQGAGQGVAFLAPMPMTGPAGQIQAFQDMRGAVATPIRVPSPIVSTMVASVPIAESVTAETVAVVAPGDGSDPSGLDPKGKNAASPKPKGRRGRKRTTSAAEMLANLSNLPPTSTPMSSMLSALASQVRGNTTIVVTEKEGEPPAKRGAVDTTQVAAMQRAPTLQDSSQVTFVVGSEATVRPNVVNHPEMPGTFPASNSATKIPHMSTFLNTMAGTPMPSMGMPFATAAGLVRPMNTFPPGMQAVPGQFFPPRVSVAVETEEIRKTTVGTNTENNQQLSGGNIDQCAVMSSSVGTMTDSLYKVSVGTGTAGTGQTNGQLPEVSETVESPSNIVEECITVQVEINEEKVSQEEVDVQEINPVEIIQEALNQEEIDPEVIIQEDVVEEVVGVTTEVAKITPIGDDGI
ncbi:hypothetical protein OS493_011340 [Desmophyllum pertusum]|uniref:Uncharacterized protein n=1 Tax=Desmophyllum pertusum TaxID=174260 RepID=A0A9W9Z2E1_9CNID|nr:hypothetical protein OS493_011340 [Desmophyllum pertusum]